MRCNRISHSLVWFLLTALVGCSSPPAPDIYPQGRNVTLKIWYASPDPFTLGPNSSKLFLDMLATEPVRSDISSMPAAPMGVFTVDGKHYDWHGNGVIRVTNGEERLWHGSFTQGQINDVMRQEHNSRETMQAILDEIENDQSVESTQVTGPGQYPGGSNDALLQPAK